MEPPATRVSLDGWPNPDKYPEFTSHYSDYRGRTDATLVDETLVEAAEEKEADLESVAEIYGVINHNEYLTSHEEIVTLTGMKFHDARSAAAVLSEMGDVHECYDDDWNLWWVRCDDEIREMCNDRRISLYRYFEMKDDLEEFQDKVVGWYERRNKRMQQNFKLGGLKEEWVHRLQREYFPEKPVGDEWSAHIAARYLRTAQDSIVRTFNLTY